MADVVEKLRHRKFKRRQKHFYRRRFMIGIYSMIAILGLVLLSPIYVGKHQKVSTSNDETSFLNTAQITLVKTQFEAQKGIVKTQFFVGNPENVDDLTDIKDLANLRYEAKAAVKNGSTDTLKSKVVRVNDNFFEVITSGVNDKFGIIRYEIAPKVINKKVDTSIADDLVVKMYSYQKNVETVSDQNLFSEEQMNNDYVSYVIAEYNNSIKTIQNRIKKSKANIAQDRELIDTLEDKLPSAVGQTKTDIEAKIDDAKSDIEVEKDEIKSNKSSISEFKEKIISVG